MANRGEKARRAVPTTVQTGTSPTPVARVVRAETVPVVAEGEEAAAAPRVAPRTAEVAAAVVLGAAAAPSPVRAVIRGADRSVSISGTPMVESRTASSPAAAAETAETAETAKPADRAAEEEVSFRRGAAIGTEAQNRTTPRMAVAAATRATVDTRDPVEEEREDRLSGC